MIEADIARLAGLVVVALVSVGAVLLLIRGERREGGAPALGFPPERFPNQELARTGALAALADTEARLAAVVSQLPPHSDLAIWLRAFLRELRAIMDAAYRAAVVAAVYGQPAPLDALLDEVQQIEAQIADQLARRLLAGEGDAQRELLEGRLAALRLCVRELTGP